VKKLTPEPKFSYTRVVHPALWQELCRVFEMGQGAAESSIPRLEWDGAGEFIGVIFFEKPGPYEQPTSIGTHQETTDKPHQ
jgi:hypothetical protein